jgi:hypothetical protein
MASLFTQVRGKGVLGSSHSPGPVPLARAFLSSFLYNGAVKRWLLTRLLPITIFAGASTVLAYPEGVPAFVLWISQGIIYVVVAPIVLIGFIVFIGATYGKGEDGGEE